MNYIINLIKNLVDFYTTQSVLTNLYPLGRASDSIIKIELKLFLKKTAILKNEEIMREARIFIPEDLTKKRKNQKSIL